jgi:hypothetical protein
MCHQVTMGFLSPVGLRFSPLKGYSGEMASEPWITDEAFDALFATLGYMLPRLGDLVERKCHLTLPGWLVLMDIRGSGAELPEGPIILRKDLTKHFKARAYNKSHLSKILGPLVNDRLIAPVWLTAEQRRTIFKSSGPKLALLLTSAGKAKLDDVKRELRVEFEQWRDKQPLLIRLGLDLFRPPAIELGKRLLHRDESPNS